MYVDMLVLIRVWLDLHGAQNTVVTNDEMKVLSLFIKWKILEYVHYWVVFAD